jgi:nucleotide-binding universal stress UspA family protein
MLRTILIGLDDSQYSSAASDLAVTWARRLESSLVGVGIVGRHSARRRQLMPLGAGATADDQPEEVRGQVERNLAQLAARCRRAGVQFERLEEFDLSYEEIVRQASRYDLLVLGHAPHLPVSTDERREEALRTVLRNTQRPVVTVPEEIQPGAGVVMAYHGRLEADHALQAFRASGLDFGEPVWVVSMDVDLNWATQCATHAAKFLQSQGIKATPHPMKQPPSTARALLDEVHRRGARMLVMGAYGRSTLRDVLGSGVTDTVVAECPVPVFLCD